MENKEMVFNDGVNLSIFEILFPYYRHSLHIITYPSQTLLFPYYRHSLHIITYPSQTLLFPYYCHSLHIITYPSQTLSFPYYRHSLYIITYPFKTLQTNATMEICKARHEQKYVLWIFTLFNYCSAEKLQKNF